MEQRAVVDANTSESNPIPRWVAWIHVLLVPVTAFWLSLYSLPFLLVLFFLTLAPFALGVILAPIAWVFVLAVTTLCSAGVAFMLLTGAKEGRSWTATVATLCAGSATLALLATLWFPILRAPFDTPAVLFSGTSVAWYGSWPWLLRARVTKNPRAASHM